MRVFDALGLLFPISCDLIQEYKGFISVDAMDDLAAVLDSVRDTDILVMAAPAYYGEVSSQMKSLLIETSPISSQTI